MPAKTAEIPLPGGSVTEMSTTGTLAASSSASSGFIIVRGKPEATTPSGLSCAACAHAALTDSGVTPALIALTFQPTASAAALRYSPLVAQTGEPHWM